MELSNDNSNDSDSDNDDVNIPSITGNYEVDEAIYIHPKQFANGIYQPRCRDQPTGIPIDLFVVKDDKICRAYQTSEGLFVIHQKKEDQNNKHQLAQICRNVLCALDELTSLQLPRNYQDLIIRQVVGQDYYPMPYYFGGNDSDSDGDESSDIVGAYVSKFNKRFKRKRSASS